MREATTQDEAGHVEAKRTGSVIRLFWFVGGSFLLHGLLAVVLLRGMLADTGVSPTALAVAPAAVEMIWFEGAAGTSTASGVPAQVPRAAKMPDPPSRAAARKRMPPAVPIPRALPRVVPAEPPAAPAEAAPSVAASQQSEIPPEASPGAVVAEAAIHGAAESASGAESELSSGETGAAAPGGGGESRSDAAPGLGAPGGAVPEALSAYGQGLYEALARQRRYPEVAVRLGMQGTAHIQLRILRNGSLMEPPRLYSSSGHEVLDAEALRMAEAAAPFAPLPDVTSRTVIGFVIPVVFSLRPHH